MSAGSYARPYFLLSTRRLEGDNQRTCATSLNYRLCRWGGENLVISARLGLARRMSFVKLFSDAVHFCTLMHVSAPSEGSSEAELGPKT
jgi:hypothetical protein